MENQVSIGKSVGVQLDVVDIEWCDKRCVDSSIDIGFRSVRLVIEYRAGTKDELIELKKQETKIVHTNGTCRDCKVIL